MNVYELIQILAKLPADAVLAHRTEEGALDEMSAEDFVIVPDGGAYDIPDGELLGPALVIGGDVKAVLPRSPAIRPSYDDARTTWEHGSDDAATYYNELGDYNRPHLARTYVYAVRAGQSLPPSDALINAMTRTWILRQAGCAPGEESDVVWDAIGRPWCAAYDRAFLSTLERIATS